MPRVAVLEAEVTLDASDIKRGARDASDALKKTKRDITELDEAFDRLNESGQSIQTLGGMLTAGITAPLMTAGAVAANAASSTEEAINKVNVVLGQSGQSIIEWSKTSSEAFGQSRLQALEAAGTFGNLFNTMGLGQEQSAKMSVAITELASDLGSFHNIKPEEALHKLQSGLVGEAEALRSLGVLINENNVKQKAYVMGIAETGAELTEQQKVMARYALIMEQTKVAQGDFDRTSQGLANQQRILSAEIQNTAAKVGGALLPGVLLLVRTITPPLRVVSDLFVGLPKPIQGTIIAVGLLTAALGPLIMATGSVLSGWAAIRNALVSLRTIVPTVTAVTGGYTTATVANTGAVAANTTAEVANVGAKTSKLGVLGRLAPFLRGVGIVGAAVGAAHLLGNYADARAGKQGVSFGDTLGAMGLNPWYNPSADADKAIAERRAEFEKARAAGMSPRQQIIAQQTAASSQGMSAAKAMDPKDARAISELQYQNMLQAAKNSTIIGDDSSSSSRELEALLPVMNRRMEELKAQANTLRPQMQKSADAQKEYYSIVSDIGNIQEQILHMQMREAKERQQANEKRARMELNNFKADMEMRGRGLDIMVLRGQAGAASEGSLDPNVRQIRESRRMRPILEARKRDALSLARMLQGQGINSLEEEREYHDAVAEYWRLQKEINDLAYQEGRARLDITKEQTAARKKAREDFEHTVKEMHEKQIEEQKRHAEAQRKASDDQRSIADARVRLLDAQLKNNPLLTEAQRSRALIPLMLKQYQDLLRPSPGETELERLQRQTEAATLRSGIFGAAGMGQGSFKRTLGGGVLPMFNRREYEQLEKELQRVERGSMQPDRSGIRRATSEAKDLAQKAAGGRPLVAQVVVDNARNDQDILRAVSWALRELGYRSDPRYRQ